jgi:hypothetical protein
MYVLRVEEAKHFAFHWHPDGKSDVTWPHLHVYEERKLHVPTGRVAIEQIVRLAIDLGAPPIRDDWEDVLARSLSRFQDWRTWA